MCRIDDDVELDIVMEVVIDALAGSWGSHGTAMERRPGGQPQPLGQALAQRKHANVVVITLANKTARLAWAITRHDKAYDPDLASQAA